MGLQRVGVLLVGLGILVATLTAVTVGATAGSTDVRCVDHEPSYAVEEVDITSLSVNYTDGCNTISIQPLVTAGGGLVVVGSLVGLVGIGRTGRRE